jgi:hypothetical protein
MVPPFALPNIPKRNAYFSILNWNPSLFSLPIFYD